MTVKIESIPIIEAQICPFEHSCPLPKIGTICNYLACKICPEFQYRVKILKMKSVAFLNSKNKNL
ncbi:MAG: hypothetical protein ACQERB_04120 [Promethearchaeati archaeon]